MPMFLLDIFLGQFFVHQIDMLYFKSEKNYNSLIILSGWYVVQVARGSVEVLWSFRKLLNHLID